MFRLKSKPLSGDSLCLILLYTITSSGDSLRLVLLYMITLDDGLDLSRNMLWYYVVNKTLKHCCERGIVVLIHCYLLQTKDCCTYSLLLTQQDAFTHNNHNKSGNVEYRTSHRVLDVSLKREPLLYASLAAVYWVHNAAWKCHSH
jgi:hypothetical protein